MNFFIKTTDNGIDNSDTCSRVSPILPFRGKNIQNSENIVCLTLYTDKLNKYGIPLS